MKKKFTLLITFLAVVNLTSCNFIGVFRAIETPANTITNNEIKQHFTKPWAAYWIGHATVLVRIYDKWFITDPSYADTAGLIAKRFVALPIQVKNLPKISFSLISHLHLDHFDLRSLHQMRHDGALAVPKDMVNYLPQLKFEKIFLMQYWQSVTYDEVKVTAVPARHFGGRFGADILWTKKPYTGYIIEYKGVTIYFAGDTGRDDTLYKAIGKKYKIDLALIPMGPARSNRSDLVRDVHLMPQDAVKAFEDLGANFMLPIHHSTFYIRGESEPRLIRDAILHSKTRDRIFLINIGQGITTEKINGKKVVKII